MHHGPVGLVAERDALEAHVSRPRREDGSVRLLLHGGLGIQELEEAVPGRVGAGKDVHDEPGGAHRHLQQRQPELERGEVARGHAAGVDLAAPTQNTTAAESSQTESRNGSLNAWNFAVRVGVLEQPVDLAVELLLFELLAGERFHHALAGEVLLQDRRHLALHALHAQPDRAQHHGHHRGLERHRRDEDEGNEAHLRVRVDHEPVGDDDERDHVEQADHAHRHEEADALHVCRGTRHNLTHLGAVVVREREALEAVVDLVAKVPRDALADRLAEVRLHIDEDAAQERGGDHEPDGDHQCRHVALGFVLHDAAGVRDRDDVQAHVDGVAGEGRGDDREDARAEQDEDRQREHPAVLHRLQQEAQENGGIATAHERLQTTTVI
jgi:hypothetical protein